MLWLTNDEWAGLRHRRGMYLPDVRYATLVGFVCGLLSADDRQDAGREFQEWVSARFCDEESSLVWWALIAHAVHPSLISADIWSSPLDWQEEICQSLLNILQEYIQELRGRAASLD